jgi:hypothetical protein
MKKLIAMISMLLLLGVMVNTANAKPILIGGIKIYWAKWSVTFGDCMDGKGLCFDIVIGSSPSSQNFFGYDPETEKVILKVNKNEPEARRLNSPTYTLEEDSPVNPRITGKLTEIKANGKLVVLKKGTYKILDDGAFYTLNIDYYLQ